ncbi:MAG: hypothetical protein K6F27_02740 [Ruminococcus sp.]|nr:hypothetical protein [Ruminococcus sp.]
MMKKIISAILALAMLLSMTACAQDNSEPTDSSSASDSSQVNTESENSSESDADSSSASGSDSSSENSADDSSTVNSETTSATTTTTENSTATTTTKAQATTTTKQAVATTKATVKPVQTTKATVRTTAKATTKATVKTTPKATQPAVNTAAYVNNIIADINKMFPESQFNKALYDKFERLCKGVPTNDDLYQIKEQLCNYAMRKYNGKKGTFTYYQNITPTPKTNTVTATKPINISIDRTLGEIDAHHNIGEDTNLVYTTKRSAAENYKYIGIFIRGCYAMVDKGIPSLVKMSDNQYPNITIKHTFYVFIGLGGHNYSTGTTEYYLWFCDGYK